MTCELNSSKSAGGNSHLPFHDDFDVSCTLSKCNSCRTHDQFCPLWVIGELSFPKVPKTSQTSCSTMTLMSLVHSGSLSRVRCKTTFARYESNDTQLCRKCWKQLKPSFHDDFYVVGTCCKFESCTTPSQYSELWVTWNFISSFDIASTFWKVPCCATRGEFFLWWVTWALNSSQSAGENHTSCFTMMLMSPLHSPTFRFVPTTSSIFRYDDMRSKLFIKYRRQLISLVFTMTFISFVHSASFSRVRRKTSFLRHEWC